MITANIKKNKDYDNTYQAVLHSITENLGFMPEQWNTVCINISLLF